MDAEAVFAACERYEAMQESHLRCFAATEPLDLEQLAFQRDQHFADLYNHLTALLYHLRTQTDTVATVEQVHERLRVILQREAGLATCLAAYRALLEQRREQLQYGQKVLNGYSGFPLNTPARLLDTST